jgi:hypothetical protein
MFPAPPQPVLINILLAHSHAHSFTTSDSYYHRVERPSLGCRIFAMWPIKENICSPLIYMEKWETNLRGGKNKRVPLKTFLKDKIFLERIF